ncbi:MAG: hypothetical protein J7J16_01065 [Deltaproteobacteria bacterium]|nr:hypothetical protein [Deltaproteobacteria bacterium]
METLDVTVEIWRIGDHFMAFCPELCFATKGATEDAAKKSLVELCQKQYKKFVEEGSLKTYLEEAVKDMWRPSISIDTTKSLIKVEKVTLTA